MAKSKIQSLRKVKFSPLKEKYFPHSSQHVMPMVAVVLLIAALGIHFVFTGHAATLVSSSEAESGTVAGKACINSDAAANGGSSVKFGTTTCTASGGAPTTPPVMWCENGLPTSPYTSAPAGAVTVAAGNNASSSVNNSAPNTTYWFAPGTHTGLDIQTDHGDRYVGAPGAIIDGGNSIAHAFTGMYNDTADQNVTIEYLTIQHYKPDNGGGSVNSNGNNGWTEQYNLMTSNAPGAAMMLGGNNTVTNNCLTNNGEYGAQGYSYVDQTYEDTFTGGAVNITFTGNDVSFNNTARTTYGVEGGVKFWQNGNVVVTGNYVHDNIQSPGIWADTDNAGFKVEGNYISNNGAPGFMYEISYNANIVNNTFIGNSYTDGPANPGFPSAAIYISESGGDSSVPSTYPGILNIQNNVFTDNWGGVTIYQNSDRYVGDGQDPGTITPPAGVDMQQWINTDGPNNCPTKLSVTSPINYHVLCQWRSQNVTVQNNQFNLNPNNPIFGGKCTANNNCGQNALMAPYGSLSAYPAYTIPNAISNLQNNHFKNNTYTGPWTFMYFNQGTNGSWANWTNGASNVDGSGYSFPAQDSGSTIH
ncbi:MAG TPA: right-handed parallel beta-helix repeat-containing protein [Candidatus Saccharimonadales bacterium]|nr:right-handed parallel beta-helix repeat-containing protein [Candidatus Saccharimonadales bacterium]